MHLFIHRLHGDPIGFSVLNIFVIEKNTILAVSGRLRYLNLPFLSLAVGLRHILVFFYNTPAGLPIA